MKRLGIYHQIDLEVMDFIAKQISKNKDHNTIRKEAFDFGAKLGIGPKTINKRINPALSAWLREHDFITEQAKSLFLKSNRNEQIAIHIGLLFRSYPFFYSVATQIGVSFNLGQSIRHYTIRNRMSREYGESASVDQATRKVLQSFLSWDLIEKDSEIGTYKVRASKSINPETSELLIACCIKGGERISISKNEVFKLPALFPFIISELNLSSLILLDYTIESSRNQVFYLKMN